MNSVNFSPLRTSSLIFSLTFFGSTGVVFRALDDAAGVCTAPDVGLGIAEGWGGGCAGGRRIRVLSLVTLRVTCPTCCGRESVSGCTSITL